ncbi:acyl-CoA thioesterase [Xanthobacter sp. TB0136]|uniref:acyl-CoA thioesterase n=1 Tax=Xanthobacter sp. TB0136 TaxID=3459177 RepID=UPI0040397CE4
MTDNTQMPAGAPAIRTIAMPADTNAAGDIFGGWLMAQMDLAAGNVAARRAKGRTVTAAVEAISFISPVFVGDEVSLFAEIEKVGRTSIRIDVAAWRRDRGSSEAVKVTQAVFTCVAVDKDGHPRPLPPEGA